MPRITITEPGKNQQPYRFDLATQEVKIGRRSENEIIIECGSVSGSHAKMVRVPGGFELSDLGSTNGITRGGERVERWLLSNGDQLLLGDVVFDFQLNEEEIATLADEIPATPEETKPKPKKKPETATQKKARPAPAISGPSGGWVMVLFLVLGLFAFYLGFSMRHKNETGMTLGQRLTESDNKSPAAGDNGTPATDSDNEALDAE